MIPPSSIKKRFFKTQLRYKLNFQTDSLKNHETSETSYKILLQICPFPIDFRKITPFPSIPNRNQPRPKGRFNGRMSRLLFFGGRTLKWIPSLKGSKVSTSERFPVGRWKVGSRKWKSLVLSGKGILVCLANKKLLWNCYARCVLLNVFMFYLFGELSWKWKSTATFPGKRSVVNKADQRWECCFEGYLWISCKNMWKSVIGLQFS